MPLAAGLVSLALVFAGCSSGTPDLESIGLATETEIQAGQVVEVAFVTQPDAAIRVVSAPTGVTATIAERPQPGERLLQVEVDAATPRGSYDLGILVVRKGEVTLRNWPFEVVD